MCGHQICGKDTAQMLTAPRDEVVGPKLGESPQAGGAPAATGGDSPLLRPRVKGEQRCWMCTSFSLGQLCACPRRTASQPPPPVYSLAAPRGHERLHMVVSSVCQVFITKNGLLL